MIQHIKDWFNISKSIDILTSQILDAHEKGAKLEFKDDYLFFILNNKMKRSVFYNWIEDNKHVLGGRIHTINGVDKISTEKLDLLSDRSIISLIKKEFMIFDFTYKQPDINKIKTWGGACDWYRERKSKGIPITTVEEGKMRQLLRDSVSVSKYT